MKRGLFITLEGGEGAGKSSAMQFIKEFLTKHGISLIMTREPGGTEIAEKIRNIILNHHSEVMHPMTEMLLYFASRAQHINQVILPALVEGKWVISDRFTDASYAYQGAGRGMPVSQIAILEQLVQGDLRPDLTIIFDVEVEIGFERVKKGRELDRLEIEKIDFYQRVRDCYLKRAIDEPGRFRVIDASSSKIEVVNVLQGIMEEMVK